MIPFPAFARLSSAERQATLLAIAAIPAMTLGLRLFGLRAIARWMDRSAAAGRGPQSASLSEIVRAVARASRYGAHRGTCLSRSLALKWLLGRHGWTSDLRIGARRSGTTIDAHAWLERDGVILNDTPDATRAFGALDTAPRRR